MDPRIQIRIRIHTKMSWIRNTESPAKQNASLQAWTRAARGVYLSTVTFIEKTRENHSMGPSVISYWTSEAKKYKGMEEP